MSDPSRIAPPPVQAAAKIVNDWLRSVEQSPVRRDLHAEWAAKLERAHSVDQSKMPAWRDPRAAGGKP
jgi:hypothetical protein